MPAMTAVFFLSATAVRAQDAKWRALSKEAEVLLRAGKLNDALATETEAAEPARRLSLFRLGRMAARAER